MIENLLRQQVDNLFAVADGFMKKGDYAQARIYNESALEIIREFDLDLASRRADVHHFNVAVQYKEGSRHIETMTDVVVQGVYQLEQEES